MKIPRILSVAGVLAAALFAAALPAAAATPGVTANLQSHVFGTYAGANGLGAVTFSFDLPTSMALAAGTGTGKADKLFSDQRTLAASATESLDLAGVLADPFGSTLTFVHVKWIYLKAAAGNTNDVCIGGAASNTFVGPFADATDKVCVKPGGVAIFAAPAGAGWSVVATTGDLLKIGNSGGTTGVTYDVLIAGTSN